MSFSIIMSLKKKMKAIEQKALFFFLFLLSNYKVLFFNYNDFRVSTIKKTTDSSKNNKNPVVHKKT